MPNDNIMGIPTRACINGLTKEDTERLKNALIKKIEDNETTVNVTEDGKVIVADNSGFYLSYDGNTIGIEQDISGDYIPKTVPYLPEDVNENPLAPPNDTIMTSANIAVDPRIVRTTGNQTISGNKDFTGVCRFDRPRFSQLTLITHSHEWGKLYEITAPSYGCGYVIRLFDSYNVYSFRNAEVRVKANQTGSSGYVYNTTSVRFRMAQRTDGKWELWVYNTTTVNIGVVTDVEYYIGNKPVILGVIGEEPVIGNVYTTIVDLTNQ